ncbi:Ig domain-containing protein, partial [Frankia sp. EI5c]|uniref:Ig domain-containing protein n=1 Tax=Frankia sp. EI5c TaxID=683316 RepID=UPI002101A13E
MNISPSLALPAPPAGEVGAAYSTTFTVTGGTAPYTWSISAGSLPPGLTVNAATGQVTGTPTTAGNYTFTVRVVDASGQAATQQLTIPVAAAPTLPFPAPPDGEVAVPYTNQFTVSGGTGPFTWSVSAGALPAGLTLNPATGLLSGTPTTAGTASFAVRVVDAFNQAATRNLTLTIAPPPSLP